MSETNYLINPIQRCPKCGSPLGNVRTSLNGVEYCSVTCATNSQPQPEEVPEPPARAAVLSHAEFKDMLQKLGDGPQRVETPAAEPAETNANAIGSCAGSSPASLPPQPPGGTPEVDAAAIYCDLMAPEESAEQYAYMVPADFARTLERQRNEARAELSDLKVAIKRNLTIYIVDGNDFTDWGWTTIKARNEALAAALAEVKALRKALGQIRSCCGSVHDERQLIDRIAATALAAKTPEGGV